MDFLGDSDPACFKLFLGIWLRWSEWPPLLITQRNWVLIFVIWNTSKLDAKNSLKWKVLPTLKKLLPETFISCKHMVSSHLKMWLQGREIARQKQKLLWLLCLLHTFGSTSAPQMRSYPLRGFLLEIRKVASTMTNNPRILRHTAMGAALLFLSGKHSSSFPNWLPTMSNACSCIWTKRIWKFLSKVKVCLLAHLKEFPSFVVNSFSFRAA